MPASSSLSKEKNSNKNIINFSEIKSHLNEDILVDIDLILSGLKKVGLRRAIIVNLTRPNIGIPVVRAIVPGLETFEVSQSIMGRRARQFFRILYSA